MTVPTIVGIPVTIAPVLPDAICAGPSSIYLLDTGATELKQMAIPSYAWSSASGLLAITGQTDGCYGPGSNVWVSSSFAGGRLVKVAQPSGTVTTYSRATTACVCAGPDGNIWGASGTVVYATTPSGAVVFTISISGASLRRMCVGPDGNMWVCGGNKVYQINVSTGAVTLIVTLIGATAYDICPGPDGNLWVADEVQHGVWQVTTGGSTTFFILSGSEPYGICPGPDGNLWVADYLHTIWSVTPAGVGTPYTTTLARTSSPTGICPGPDGNLYASDSYVAASPYTYVWQVLFPTGGWHLGSIVWK